MHEFPVIKSILDICLRHTANQNVRKIVFIHLEVGELSDLEDQWMQKYFDYISKGSVAQGARLNIKRIPVVMQCETCERTFSVDIKASPEICCTFCQAKENFTLISGREYKIINLEVS